MKKGLLSLLAVALTVVGCQNYDDQFQELTDQIEGLETQIDGLPDLTSQVTQLQTTVNGLQTALTTVGNNVLSNGAAIATNAAAITGVQTAVDANGTAIASNGTAIASNGTAIASNGTAIASNGTAIASNGTSIASNLTAINANGTSIANNGTAITANGTAIAGVQGDVTTISTNVVANGTAISGVQATATQNGLDIAGVQATATQNGTDIAGVQATATQNGTDIAGVQATATQNGVDIAALSTDLAAAQADITQILADLALVATTADLMLVSSALADVAADVTEILNGTTSVNQAIRMTNDNEVAYANGLILTGGNSPSAYIINNTAGLVVDYTNLSASAKVTATAMLAKIISVLSGPADFTSSAANQIAVPVLAYVGTDLTISGYDIDYPLLTSIDNNVIFESNIGAITFTNRTVGGAVTMSTASVTSVDFTGSTIAGGVNDGYLSLPAATSINIGTGTVTKVVAPVATAVTLGQTANASSGTYANLDVSATATNAIVTLGLTSSAGTLDITTKSDNSATVNIAALASAAGAVTLDNGTYNFTSLASAAGGITATNGTYNFPALVTSGALDINTAAAANFAALTTFDTASDIEATTLTLPALLNVQAATDLNTSTISGGLSTLASVTANLTANQPTSLTTVAVVNGAGEIKGSALTALTIKDLTTADFSDLPEELTDITITAQSVDLTHTGAAASFEDHHVTASFTAAPSTGANAANVINLDIDFTGSSDSASLTTYILSGFSTANIDDTGVNAVTTSNVGSLTLDATATNLATATLNGTALVVFDSEAPNLAELNIASTVDFFDRVGLNDQPITFKLVNSDVTSVDLSSMNRVEQTTVTTNTVLTSITAPSTGTPLTAGATVIVNIYGNSLTATYTNSVGNYLGDGIQPPAVYQDASVVQPSFATWNTYLTDVSALNTMTLMMDYDKDGTGAAASFRTDTDTDSSTTVQANYGAQNQNGYIGLIDTLAELSIFN